MRDPADVGGEARLRAALQRPADGRAVVRIEAGGAEAYLQVYPASGGGRSVTEEEVRAQLHVAGVSNGLNWEAVRRAVERGQQPGSAEPEAVRVALGKAPVRGRDASIELAPVLRAAGGAPKVREDGSVDYFDLGLARSVKAGDWLARKTPATAGAPGLSVKGEPVPAADGKDPPLPAGRGTVLGEDRLTLVAAIDGYPTLVDGRVVVSPVFRVAGDVDPATGNIDFIGTVVVQGNVCAGFSVRAGADVEVHGGVEGDTVEAAGSVTIRYGVQGAGRGRVQAGGNVKARFIENGDVRAGGDIRVQDGILHSQVLAGSRVLVDGRRGVIIGGQVRAREEVAARVLGSTLAVQTEIAVGCRPELREELETLRRTLAETEENLRRTTLAVGTLQDQEHQGELPPAKKELLLKGLRGQYQLQSQREKLAERLEAIMAELREVTRGRVKAGEFAFPGVRVTIGDEAYLVDDVQPRATFYLGDDRTVRLGHG